MSSRNKPEETRAAILEAARRRFETDGYYAVGLEAVARDAGVSRQAIYLHFESKAALLHALHAHIHEVDVEPAMREVWTRPDARSGLDEFVTASAAVIPKILLIFTALEPATRTEDEALETFQPPRQGRRDECARMARWLDDEGLLGAGMKARQAADILFAFVSIPSYDQLVVTCGWSPRRWCTWTRDTLVTLLLA
jgi:AcrR family transcriptional regulator